MDKLIIIGGGKAGRTLGKLWADASYFSIPAVVDISIKQANSAVEFIAEGRAFENLHSLPEYEAVMLSVADDRIAGCADSLSKTITAGKGVVVFHLSGYYSSAVLEILRNRGCETASVHPVKTFSDPDKAVKSFRGTLCGGEGTPRALKYVEKAFKAIGGDFFYLNADRKKLYHSATVFLSNYLVALLKSGTKVLSSSGIAEEHVQKIAGTLCRETLENILVNGLGKALTGPISRGDIETVSGELEALKDYDNECYRLYKILGSISLGIAAGRPGFDHKTYQRLVSLLKNRAEDSAYE